MRISRFVLTAVLGLAAATGAYAQGAPDEPATVAVFVGASTGKLDTGVAIGGSLTQAIGERLAVEAGVLYADRGTGASTLQADGAFLVHLGPVDRAAVPFVLAGLGIYRTSIDLFAPRFLGPIGPQYAANQQVCPAAGRTGPGARAGFGPGDGLGSGAETCPNTIGTGWGVGDLPLFYARRLGPLTVPASLAWESRTFVDPSFSLGGGVDLEVGDRVTIRPEARAVIVFGGGDTHTVGQFGVRLGYRF